MGLRVSLQRAPADSITQIRTETLMLPVASNTSGWATASSEWGETFLTPMPMTPLPAPQTVVVEYQLFPGFPSLMTWWRLGVATTAAGGSAPVTTDTTTSPATPGRSQTVPDVPTPTNSDSETAVVSKSRSVPRDSQTTANGIVISSSGPLISLSAGLLSPPSPAAPSPRPSASPATHNHRPGTGPVVGIVLGAIAGAILLVLVILGLRRRALRRQANQQTSFEPAPQAENMQITPRGTRILAPPPSENGSLARVVAEAQAGMLRKISSVRHGMRPADPIVPGVPPAGRDAAEALPSEILQHVQTMAARMAFVEAQLRIINAVGGQEMEAPPEYSTS
ncbi:hypothetical protein MIND_01285700 [Mycena indigotica]|uniref:Transmembrane protein n=1 Tax=Mycena indigotica TaxID=2126181 RepID=A0A8H6S295_9AGAR|nr:uncharacterized protein MIND_01285700 [Mycena indigotica]KAF7291411.1 hypothetical protein MIND_01285700 [Mycena indigotica]